MSTCGANMGGRGRRKMTARKMKGGNFYGPGGAIAPGAMQWDSVENVAADPVSGRLIADGSELQQVKLGGRRRKSRKASKKASRKGSRKGKKGTRRGRKMRGGSNWATVAPAGGSFTGQGAGGLIDLTSYDSRMPAGGGPPQNPDGAYRA